MPSAIVDMVYLQGNGIAKPRIRSPGGVLEPWVPVTLSVVALWATAALRYGRWLACGDEKAQRWKASYGGRHSFQTILKAWLLENGIIGAFAMTSTQLFPPRDKQFKKMVAHHVARSMMVTEGTWIIMSLLVKHVYNWVPYFAPTERRPHPSWQEFLQAWVRLMIPLRALGAANDAQDLQSTNDEEYHLVMHGLKSQGLVSFLFQFAVVRSLHDLGFYLGHYLIHQPLVYGWIHKRHHEHKEPSVLTNNHFWILDLIIESGFSLAAAMLGVGLFRRAGFRLSNLELNYIVSSLLWYQNGSHAGKPLPCVTVFPPLSFIPHIDQILGGGTAHHHEHHRHLQSNYSISAWPDRAFGTWRPLLNDPKADSAADARQSVSENQCSVEGRGEPSA